MTNELDGLTILLTGGTGSFGKEFIRFALEHHDPKAIRVFSRDELKQSEMQKEFRDKRLRYLIGDVRDSNRVRRAMMGVDLVIHAAAMKQVPASEYNPFEAIKTNILGAQNIIEAAIDLRVPRVMALSTDKAANPINLYGATKLCAEKLFVQGNAYVGSSATIFSCVRYGNVIGSRGSVVPLFLEQGPTGKVTITDDRMSRFWITQRQAVEFITRSVGQMQGGEIFIPKIPSMMIDALAKALAPEAKIEVIGIRPGEKLSETLLTIDEARHAVEFPTNFIIAPEHSFWTEREIAGGTPCPEGFVYDSSTNDAWVGEQEILEMLKTTHL